MGARRLLSAWARARTPQSRVIGRSPNPIVRSRPFEKRTRSPAMGGFRAKTGATRVTGGNGKNFKECDGRGA